MKKLLALVLALVMTLSLCTISNAAFTDAKDVDASYEEAVAVLNGMGVFKGYEDGSFKPEGSITRAEVAAIVYRLYTGDVKDKQAGLYAGYGKFDDMAGAAWAAGYVGFCANAGFVKGYGDGKFGPSDPVTGYQALAMILRAVGYGKNGEFEGADWELHVAQIAQQLKVLKNVKGVSLKAAASRELVAELLFQVAAYVDTVEYTPAFGYVANTVVTAKAETLGEKNFNLTKSADGADNWGRPQYKWFSDDNGNKTVDAKETKYATIQAKPEATYTTAVTECEVADDAFRGYDKSLNLLYVNGDLLENQKYTIQAADTVTKLGAQGRLTEVYSDRIVMIDTMLATVTNVIPAKYDAAGHQWQKAQMTLQVFDGIDDATSNVVLESKTDWTYSVGAALLVNPFTVDNGGNVNNVFGGHGKVRNSSVEVLGVAESFVGSQSVVFYNAGQHVVGGVTYNDANCYHLDAAAKNLGNYTWFKDQYGNVIGSSVIATAYSYGVIKSIQWFTQSGTTGYAAATLTMMDGSEKTFTVKNIADKDEAKLTDTVLNYALYTGATNQASLAQGLVSTEWSLNLAQFFGKELYRIQENADGTVSLAAVANDLVTVGSRIAPTAPATTVTVKTGYPYITTTNTTIPVDSTTQYLFWNDVTGNYTYQAVTGYNNIPTYDADYVDYVLGADGRADYVYVVGTPTAANTAGLFYMSTTNSSYQVDADGDGLADYYQLNGYFNGAAGSIKIDADLTTGKFTGQTGAGTQATPTTNMTGAELYARLIQAFTDNDGSLLLDVDVVNGYVVSAEVVVKNGMDLNNTTGNVGPYTNLDGKRIVTSDNYQAYYNGDTLTFSTVVGTTSTVAEAYNVTTATRVIGDLPVGVYGAGYIFHVVYNGTVATEIYVYAIPAAPSGPSATGYYTLTGATMRDSGGSTFVVKANGSAGALTTANTTVTVYNARTGYQVFSTNPTVTPSGTGTYTLTLGNTLTQGEAYYAVIVANGTTLTTPVIEAQH